MSDLTPPALDLPALRRRYAAMTPGERLSEAFALTDNTAACLLQQGVLYHEMKARGDDMEPVKRRLGGMLYLLLRVGCGQVLPEVVLRFGARRDLYPLVSRLDLNDQQHLGNGGKVLVVVPGDGQHTERLADPLELPDAQVAQVFARDHIRTKAEQLSLLLAEKQKAGQAFPEQEGGFKLDHDLGTARAGNHTFTVGDLERAARALRKSAHLRRPRLAGG